MDGVKMKYTEVIQNLIDSDITSYQIAKYIGVPVQTIDRYRNGSKIENMRLGIAEKLIEYWMYEGMDKAITMEEERKAIENMVEELIIEKPQGYEDLLIQYGAYKSNKSDQILTNDLLSELSYILNK